jgi:hypothetical protein
LPSPRHAPVAEATPEYRGALTGARGVVVFARYRNDVKLDELAVVREAASGGDDLPAADEASAVLWFRSRDRILALVKLRCGGAEEGAAIRAIQARALSGALPGLGLGHMGS